MNTTDDNTRPFGYWITAVDRLMRAEFATVFEDEGITRRDWRMLNRIDGTVPDGRPVHPRKLHRLIELGWVERTREGFGLTDAGTLAKQRLGTAVDELRARVAGAVSAEEYATMTAAVEKIAREFGWEEGKRLPRSGRREHGPASRFGHRHGVPGHRGSDRGHGFGHGRHSGEHGFGHGHGFGEHESENRHGFERRADADAHGHGHRHHEMGRGFARGHHRHGIPATHIHIHTHG
ncbi:hypothetical protein [Microbacterium arabinogalactanolyticum]|uniref:hypothetical protein n=1 Tax=Microbacterium arabinogalactanolyticum TaxID=69365 RepID=UPI0025521C5B|nr:hypothetical protein [Microbacterium arabinogalactanolyticum]GLC86770.1 hypothetical protein MIAR_33550 [Microbacterium arabinogalactanolyticum]